MATTIHCPHCGKLTDPNLDNCVHCGAAIQRGRGGGKGERSQTCPNCGAMVQEGDIICVACGTNLLTGQKIAREEEQPAQKKERPARDLPMGLIGGIIAAAAVVAVGVLLFLVTRDPVARAERLAATEPLEAKNILREVIDEDPDNARAHFVLGKLRWLTMDMGGAAESFDTAARLNPDNKRAALLAALSHANVGTDAAREQAAGALERVIAKWPGELQAWRLLANLRGVLGDVDGQVEAAERVAELTPEDPGARIALAVAYARADRYADAARELEQAPAGAEGRQQAVAGLVAQLRGQPAAALELLGVAVEADAPEQALLRTQLGVAALAQRQYDRAEEVLSPVAGQAGAPDTPRFFDAVALQAVGLSEQALAVFEELAIGEGPFAAEAAAQAAAIHLDNGLVSRAEELVERAAELGGDSPAVLTIRGRVLSASGDLGEARRVLQQAVQATPDFAPARLELGLLLARRGLIPEAINELNRYVELVGPEVPDARLDAVEQLVTQLTDSLAQGAS